MSIIDESYMNTYTSTLSNYYLKTLDNDTIYGSISGSDDNIEVYIPSYGKFSSYGLFLTPFHMSSTYISSTDYTYYPATGIQYYGTSGSRYDYGIVYAIRISDITASVCYVVNDGSTSRRSFSSAEGKVYNNGTITLNEGDTSSGSSSSFSPVDEDFMESYTESLQKEFRGLYLNVFIMEGTLDSGVTGAVQFTIPTLRLYDITSSEGRYKIFTSGYEEDSGSSKGNTKFITASGGVSYNDDFWVAHSAYMPSDKDGVYRVSFTNDNSNSKDPITVDIPYSASFSALSTIRVAYIRNVYSG